MRKSSSKATRAAASSTALVPANAPATELVKLDTADIGNVSGVILDNETGDTVNPDSVNSTAPVATPDARVLKAERVAADRATLSKLYSAFESMRASIPVKPLSAFKLASTTAHPIARNPSVRQCAAIAVAFGAAGLKLAAGASAPRVFEYDGIPSAIENGVLRDAVSSGLVTITGTTPESEKLKLTKSAVKTISGLLGEKLLTAAQLI